MEIQTQSTNVQIEERTIEKEVEFDVIIEKKVDKIVEKIVEVEVEKVIEVPLNVYIEIPVVKEVIIE